MVRFRTYIQDRAMSFSWHCDDRLKVEPNSTKWQYGDSLARRWLLMLGEDRPSISKAEQLVAELSQFAKDQYGAASNASAIAVQWLNELKGGEGVNPLKEYEEYWAEPKDGQYALFGDEYPYSIGYAYDDGMFGTVTIEDAEVWEAVQQKMLEMDVLVAHDLHEATEFARRWKKRQSKGK